MKMLFIVFIWVFICIIFKQIKTKHIKNMAFFIFEGAFLPPEGIKL